MLSATSFGTRGSQVQILPLRPAFFTIEAVTGNDMGDETVAQRKHFAPIDRCRSRRLHFVERRKFQLGLPCSLYPQKRTFIGANVMSALRQKQTFCAAAGLVTHRRTRAVQSPFHVDCAREKSGRPLSNVPSRRWPNYSRCRAVRPRLHTSDRAVHLWPTVQASGT